MGSNESDSVFSVIATVVSADEIIADVDGDDAVVVVTSLTLFPVTLADHDASLPSTVGRLGLAGDSSGNSYRANIGRSRAVDADDDDVTIPLPSLFPLRMAASFA